jgi:hypothetical protein
MLRVLKPTSPMSVGSWLLAGYGPAATLCATTELTGRAPRLGRLAGAGAAALGPAVATYTSALLADTAVPAWHAAYRELPFAFAGSAATAAGGVGLLAAPVREAGPARGFAVLGAAVELAAVEVAGRRLGLVAEPYHQGRAGVLMRVSEALTAVGALGAATVARRNRAAAVASGTMLLAGSACGRFGIFRAGMQSAEDPRYTVQPQRERLDRGEPASHRPG